MDDKNEEQEIETTEEKVEEEEIIEEASDADTPEDFSSEESNDNNFVSDNGNKELIRKLGMLAGVILVAGLVIGLLLWIVSLFSGPSYTYEDVEEIMKEAAESYFADHKKSLPKSKQVVEITTSVLVKNEYMKDLTEYLGDDSKCSGKVSVKKVDSKYIYTPYLNCGEEYTTTELYKILKKKVVSSGSGLYRSKDGYIFRGERPKNYVKLKGRVWRAVKINSDNEVMLVSNYTYQLPSCWDDRYNVTNDYNSGINDYKASRIKEYLNKLYNEKNSYNRILTSSDRSKLTTFDLCIGKRDVGSSIKDNSVECSERFGNQKIGLLTVSDYMFASLDNNCNKDTDLACQNYNYLNNAEEWYTATAVKSDNFKAFYINSNGEIIYDEAMNYLEFRPVIMLNNSTMIKSGKGTKKKPYKLK